MLLIHERLKSPSLPTPKLSLSRKSVDLFNVNEVSKYGFISNLRIQVNIKDSGVCTYVVRKLISH